MAYQAPARPSYDRLSSSASTSTGFAHDDASQDDLAEETVRLGCFRF